MILVKRSMLMMLVLAMLFTGCSLGQTYDANGDTNGERVTVTQPVVVEQPEPVTVQPQTPPVTVEEAEPVVVETQPVIVTEDQVSDINRTTGETIAGTGISGVNTTDMDVMQALQAAGATTFANLAEDVRIVEELNGGGTFDLVVLGGLGGGPYSVFAPSDEAFSRVPSQTLNEIREGDDLEAIIKRHIVDGTDLGQRGETIGAIEGGPVDLITSDDRVVGVNNATVLRTVPYTYGVIYVIDQVLLPEDQTLVDRYGLDTIEWGSGLAEGERIGAAGTAGTDRIDASDERVTVTQPVIVEQPEPVRVQPETAPVSVEEAEPVVVETETVPVVVDDNQG